MSSQGILLIDLVGMGLILMILNLVRIHRLHVGYAVIWVLALLGLICAISVPPLLALVTKAVGAIFPASALSMLAFIFIFSTLVLFSVQLSILSARQVKLAQAIALQEPVSEEIDSETGTDIENQ